MTETTYRYIPVTCSEHKKVLMYTHWDYECPVKGCKTHMSLESIYFNGGPKDIVSDKDPNDDR